jgi:hypothetical protein
MLLQVYDNIPVSCDRYLNRFGMGVLLSRIACSFLESSPAVLDFKPENILKRVCAARYDRSPQERQVPLHT